MAKGGLTLNSMKKTKYENDSIETNNIGEKGIGFKSIFAVVNKAHIKSKYFSFVIAASVGLCKVTNFAS